MFHSGLPLGHWDCYSLYEHDPRLFSNRKLKSSKRASYMCSWLIPCLYPEPWNLGDSPVQVSWNRQFPSYPSQQIFLRKAKSSNMIDRKTTDNRVMSQRGSYLKRGHIVHSSHLVNRESCVCAADTFISSLFQALTYYTLLQAIR